MADIAIHSLFGFTITTQVFYGIVIVISILTLLLNLWDRFFKRKKKNKSTVYAWRHSSTFFIEGSRLYFFEDSILLYMPSYTCFVFLGEGSWLYFFEDSILLCMPSYSVIVESLI